MNRAITISREYGSGGREINEKLAQRLGIPFYDKGLIVIAAEEGNIETSVLEVSGEVGPGLDNYSSRQVLPGYQIATIQRIYAVQAIVIRSLNDKGPCATVGHYAGAMLPDVVNVFMFADMESRINRVMSLNPGLAREEAKVSIPAVDKRHKACHEYYSTTQREDMNAYDICLNNGLADVEGCLEVALTYIRYIK